MAKRGHNEGTVYQRKDGRWVACLRVHEPSGKVRKIYRYRRTRTEARTALRELLRKQEDGHDLTQGNPTLAAFLERWLTDSAQPSVRPKTHQGYRSIVEHRIVPRIGGVKLSQLTPAVVQNFYVNLATEPLDGRASGLSSHSCVNTHRVLRKALEQAVRWGMIHRNPCSLVDAPRAQREEMQTLTAEQVGQLLATTQDERLHGLYAVAVSTGLRLGECLGLKWSDIDFEGRRLFIRRSLQRVSGQGLILTEPKTKKSRRTVKLSQQATHALRGHRLRQIEERLAAGSEWNENDLVFATEIGTPLDPGAVSRSFKRSLQRHGLPIIRFHDLRHTAASLLLQAGTHVKLVSEMLGHSSVVITLDTYSHVLPIMHDEVADTMDRIFSTV